MSDVDDQILGEVTEFYDLAAAERRKYEADWFLNLAFYQGHQWLRWDGNQLFPVQLRGDRAKVTVNRIKPVVDIEVAKLTQQRPSFAGTPGKATQEAIDETRLGERVLDHLWDALDLQRLRTEAAQWTRIVCAGLWRVTWDSSLGDGVEVLVDADGQPVEDNDRPIKKGVLPAAAEEALIARGGQWKQVNAGNVDIRSRSPLAVYPDPIATRLGDCPRLVDESVLSPDDVHRQFAIKLAPDVHPSSGITESRFSAYAHLSTSRQPTGVLVREYWERPTKERPKGRYVAWAQGNILRQGENPYWMQPFNGLPYVMFRGSPVPDRFWPKAIVDDLRPIQVWLNKLISQLLQNTAHFGNPSLLISQMTRASMKGRTPNTMPGQVITYADAATQMPQYLTPPSPPGYIGELLQQLIADIQDVSGAQEVQQSSVPAGVTAASAINLLQESYNTRLSPAVEDFEKSISEAGQMILHLLAQYASDERLLQLAGEDGAYDIVAFRGSMLGDVPDVKVVPYSTFPKSKAAKQAAIRDFFSLFLQYGIPMHETTVARMLRELEVGGVDQLVADVTADQKQIAQEHMAFARGENVDVHDYDNHLAHIEGHEDVLKARRLDRAAHARLEAHLLKHKKAIAPPQLPPGEAAPTGPGPAGPPPGMIQGQMLSNPGPNGSAQAIPAPEPAPLPPAPTV